MKIIDLSLPIDDTLVETHAATIDRITHAQGVEHFNWEVMSNEIVEISKGKVCFV